MKSVGLKIFGFVLVLALASLACALPSVDSILNPLPKDDFSSSSSGWGTGTDSNSSVEYANGGLQMIVYTPHYVTWSTPDTIFYENVHLEASVTSASTDSKAMFGFVCNEQATSNSFYYVGVAADGYYAFIKSSIVADDEYLKEGNSDVISAAGNSMRIGLDCGNGNMALYVNGQQIDSVADSTYTSGVVGIFAANGDQESGTDITFDDFVVTKISQ
jgi:hypothetical protein